MTVPRFHVPLDLAAGARLALPERAVRHLQVLRLQPGETVHLFDGASPLDWPARIERIGKRDIEVTVASAPEPVDRELPRRVVLALGMPANDRMDTLIGKATELGAAGIVPLVTARSVLRLDGARAESRQRHWQAIAEAACEQCGRARVPAVAVPGPLAAFLARGADAAPEGRDLLLSVSSAAGSAEAAVGAGDADLRVLSGPEGGLTGEEEEAALAAGFAPVTLGPRTLRADTAPLALLAWLALRGSGAAA